MSIRPEKNDDDRIIRILRQPLPRANRIINGAAIPLSLFAAIPIVILVLGLTAASQQPIPLSHTEKQPPPPEAYAGDAACQSCHKESTSYMKTAHHFTSRPANAQTILGDFTKPGNLMTTANPNLGFVMSATPDGFFQSALDITDPDRPRMQTEPFDIAVGSGRKGQTYLYWGTEPSTENLLYELPVSYWTETHQWINSPAFRDGYVKFDIPIVPRCLDCHGTYFQSQMPPANRYLKSSLVLGIGCEKCHGPGAEHVKRERSTTSPAKNTRDLAILNPAHFTREQQLDLCSLCHAGAAEPLATVGSFLPGDPIDKYLKIADPGPNLPVDVHGNQVLALKRSRCFRSSQMTCSTCHNVHEQQRDPASYSKDCLGCHKIQSCGRFAKLGESIRSKCADCHMPLQKSQALYSDNSGRHIEPLVRNHQIAIYPEAVIAK